MTLPALGSAGLSGLAEAIADLDPDGEFVTIDVEKQQVNYSQRIKQHELIREYVGEEEPVRAYLIAWLCTTGLYPPESLELERSYSYGRGGSAQLDLRISDPSDPSKAFALIETKPPNDWGGHEDPRIRGQLFALTAEDPDAAVLSLVTAEAGDDGVPLLRTITIDFHAGLTFRKWKAQHFPHVEDFPVNYQEPTQEPYAPGTDRDLRTDLSLAQLDRIRRELHNKLWGGSRDDNQIYAWLVRLFLTKIHDEKVTDEGDAYRFQVFHLGSVKESPLATLERINECYREAYERYVDPDPDHVDPLDNSLFSVEEIQWAVETLQGLSLTSAGQSSGDLLGGFFEAITREGYKQSKGLFFTHYNLAIFMLEVLDIGSMAELALASHVHTNDRLPYIIDPSCGSGTFLLAAMRTITKHIDGKRSQLSRNRDVKEQVNSKFPESSPNQWAKDFIYGIEKREDLAISTKVNMVLHQDGHTHVINDDGLKPLDDLADKHQEQKLRTTVDAAAHYEMPIAGTFDVVLTNPPFSITLDGSVKEHLASNFELASDKNSENLFLERWYQLLKHGGRLAAVLPESFFSTTENINARLFLFGRFHVRAIVSLPAHTFQPWTPTRTSLLFAQKKTAKEESEWITYFDQQSAEFVARRKEALSLIRRLLKPAKSATPPDLTSLLSRLPVLATSLKIDLPDTDSRSPEYLDEANVVVKACDPLVLAFSATVDHLHGPDFLGVIVKEVGYRRTKRGENSARNDLFRAVEDDPAGGQRSVRNLNDAKSGWVIAVEADRDDALARIRKSIQWS